MALARQIGSGAGRWAGGLCLAAAAAASLLLSLNHLGGLRTPGCGEGSPCARAEASFWGRVPFTPWPTAFVGLAYFAALLAVWARPTAPDGAARERRRAKHITSPAPSAFLWLLRVAVLASIGLTVAMIRGGYVCPYCVVVHVGHIGFWIVLEAMCRSAASGGFRMPVPRRGAEFIRLAGAFAGLSLVLFGVERVARRSAAEAAEKELAESTAKLITAATASAPAAASRPASSASTRPGAMQPVEVRGLTGRHHRGPETSPIRMVVFSDYQCIDCQRVEAEVRAALARRPEMSLGVRHFPMCSDCNPHVTRTLHAAACTAARVAEAAALLKGEAGFWPMHEWLFDVGGSFTGEQLDARLRELGFDVARFRAAMNDEAVTRAIQEDADLAVALGLHFTPLMYINGVELRGWQARNAVTRAVDALAARNPPPATSDNDRPPLALEKYIADWREQPAIRPPPDATRWPLGPDSARVRVVVFGDLMEPNTGEVDALLRRVCAQRQDVQYDFRHYPFNQECNPNVTSTRFPAACRAARAVEAAGRLGGAETYWRAMAWLVQNRDRFSDAALVALATDIQLDAAALQRAVDEPAGAAAIAEDVAAGKRLGVRSIPSVYVNHRLMPRWKLGDQPLVERIIDEAARP